VSAPPLQLVVICCFVERLKRFDSFPGGRLTEAIGIVRSSRRISPATFKGGNIERPFHLIMKAIIELNLQLLKPA